MSKRHPALFLTRLAAVLLCSLAVCCMLPSFPVHAKEQKKIVRVGWYESPYNTIDEFGRRSGYAYEYQLKIASYTGWSYEYINGSWSDLMQMLSDGRIDLMSDVSYTRERAEYMLYPEEPMGTEDYYLFISSDNRKIVPGDTSTLNGKRIGVNKDSIQAGFYKDWAARNNVEAQLIELNIPENDSLHMLEAGTLDAFITVDSFTDLKIAVPAFKIGSSDFYFAVNKNRPDLLADLNGAMNSIQNEDRYYNEHMSERYIRAASSNAFLTPAERDWVLSHGAIRVGYQDDYLAFCAEDETTGELTGAIKDFLEDAQNCLENAELSFEPKAYPTIGAAIDAMKKGELDCVFPANFSGYDGEKHGIVMTPALIRTDIYAIVRQTDVSNFTNRDHVVVAVNQGNPNYDAFLQEHFPGWRSVYYENTAECLKQVSNGMADCVLISSYRYNNVSRLCKKYNLTTIPTSIELDYCFAVAKGNPELYSVLAKVVNMIPDSAVDSALSFYITEDARLTLSDFMTDNLAFVMACIAIVILVIILLLIHSRQMERQARALISATEDDDLTGLYNRDYFFEYVNRMRREQHDVPMDAMVLNIEHFHSINALNGREFGDHVLQVLGNEIGLVAGELKGIAGRFDADRFDIFCPHTEDYQTIYNRFQSKLDELAQNANIRLRMGVLAGRTGVEPVQMFDMARTACSMARGHFKEHLVIFDEIVREREMYEQRLLGDLHRALENYEFEVYYQPKYDIRIEPAKLSSAEALIRWQHPQLGMITPDDFIPLFEKSGNIEELDRYVWEQAARQISRWRLKSGVVIPVSVNLSRIDVFNPKLEETLDRILSDNGLEHDAFKLEVTESAYIDNADQLIQVVDNLRKKGYTVEMDDFGTGYSSLNMLSSISIDVLKMDKSFIRNLDTDEKTVQLVELILGIARIMDVPVVAEGVETESQLKLLKQLGCALVQGYYFSRPLHPSDFEARFLQDPGR